MSLDGYIAGPNGEIDWLDAGGDAGEGDTGVPDPVVVPDDYGYQEFYDSIDTTLMGNSTYPVTLTVDKFPYPDKTNYVFTKGAPPQDTIHVRFVSGDIASFVRSLKEQPGKDIWLVGGGQINTVMLNAGLIDEMILTAFPLVLGEGVPLFAPGATRHCFRTLSCHSYETGVIQWHRVKK